MPSAGRVVAAGVVAAAVIGLLLVTARAVRRPGQLRSALLATAAGACFCMTAVLVVALTDAVGHRDLTGTLASLGALAASATVGALFVQDSFASGSLTTALTAMTIADPIISWTAGLALFDAAPPPGLAVLGGMAAAALMLAWGVAVLARLSTLHADPALEQRRAGPVPAVAEQRLVALEEAGHGR